MKQLFAIARFTVKENISNKVFNAFILFSLLIMFSTVILKELSLYESVRVIKDTGLFLIEILLLLITIFISANSIIKAKQEKSIYLILTKPVTRSTYINGLSLGIVLTILLNLLLMSTILALVLLWQKYIIDLIFLRDVLFIFLRLSLLALLGLLFSIISESFMTANIFTLGAYVIANSAYELKLMVDKVDNLLLKFILNVLYYILPNFRVLNSRDYLKNIDLNYEKVFLYVFAYALICLTISNILFFRKKL